MSGTKAGRKTSRMARTIRSLIYMGTIGTVLTVYSSYSSRQDVLAATGPVGESQRQFFIVAATRPDITTFFKRLTHEQRMKMSENIGHYTDSKLASLVGQLLADFDADARLVLTTALKGIGHKHPSAVAEQLKQKGSFQTLAVAAALKDIGPSVIPDVIAQLKVGDARPNAIAFLVGSGEISVGPLLAKLSDTDKDVRLAAADALGKLRAHEASQPLTDRYQNSTGDEKLGYLTALSGIGDRRNEQLMAKVLTDEAVPTPQRAQAALGLGRIASLSATKVLWDLADDDDSVLRQATITALQLCGDTALIDAKGSKRTILAVASGINSTLADSNIRSLLKDSDLGIDAIQAAANRPSLTSEVSQLLSHLDRNKDGDRIDACVQTLLTTDQGRTIIKSLEGDDSLKGFVLRRTSKQS